MKRIIGLFTCMMLAVSVLATGGRAHAATNLPLRIINVVYDDSGSMIEMNGEKYDTWCQAKYSMEVFAGMLGENDIMNIYVMSDYNNTSTSAGPRLTLKGIDGSASNVSKVHDMITSASNTPFNSVRKAYSDLAATTADEKWLVVLTDGEFQNVDDMDAYFAQKASDVKVMFLGMGEAAGVIKADEANSIFFEKAETNSQILNKITDICTRIFQTDKLEVDINSKAFSFDIPMSELVVFAQGADVQINGLTKSDGTKYGNNTEPVSVKYSEVATTNSKYKDFKVATDLKGSIATFKGDFEAGNYTVDVTGAETIEIYYKPNIELAAYLTNDAGVEVSDSESIEAGEYIMTFGFVKAGTDEKVADSKLLGDVSYEAYITVNGTQDGRMYASGDKVTVEEGTFHVDVTANYLRYNTLSAQLDFGIFRNKELILNVTDSPEYTIVSEGFENADRPIKVEATLEGQPLTAEQWAAINEPVVEVIDHNDDRISLRAEKSDEVGVFHIYPSLTQGKTTIGDYDDMDFAIRANARYGDEAWTGETTGTLEITDLRSWFEKNLDKVIKLGILLLLLLLILGYIPPFKKYLPKKLKTVPTIDCKPNIPGKRKWTANGRFTKKRLTTILPYKAEEGTIRFLPTGVSGVPALQVKAAGDKRMTITNTKSYAGKKEFTIDGTPVMEGTRKNMVKGAGMIIKYDTRDTDYTCSPNK